MKLYKRAGVIPYTIINGSAYFLLGKDTQSGELTDFGGGVKLGEEFAEGAVREFKEETNGIFSESTYDSSLLKESPHIKNVEMTIYFLKIDKYWLDYAPRKFFFKTNDKGFFRKKTYQEIADVVWLHEGRFQKLVKFGGNTRSYDKNSHIMWKKIQMFLSRGVNDDFMKILKSEV